MRCLALSCLLLGGCMTAESDCRTSDWYGLGERDARIGIRPQIDLYVAQCSRFQVQPAEHDYLEGWASGYSQKSLLQPD
jgi:Protein of unknown function (DUF2799)